MPEHQLANGHTEEFSLEGRLPDMTEAAMRRAVKGIDFNEVLKWKKVEAALEQFHALIENPPLHSVVIHIEPAVAAELLKLANHGNRRYIDRHAQRLAKVIKSEDYELTGDTMKFSVEGRLLDGQHRLNACVLQGSPIISHVVFGLEESIFDLLDQGKKRNAGDILGLKGYKEPQILAGAIRFAQWYRYKNGGKGDYTDDSRNTRKIREAAEGWARDMPHWIDYGRQINKAYKRFKHQPSVITAILWLIAKHDKSLATSFAEEWLNGKHTGRNKGFENLHQRITKLVNESGRSLSGEVRSANIIQLFNNWNADIVASPRALTWRKEWTYPALEFDPKAVRKAKQNQPKDQSLPAQKYRLLNVLQNYTDHWGNVSVSYPQLANLSDLHVRHVGPAMLALCKDRQLKMVEKAKAGAPPTYHFGDAAKKYLAEYSEQD